MTRGALPSRVFNGGLLSPLPPHAVIRKHAVSAAVVLLFIGRVRCLLLFQLESTGRLWTASDGGMTDAGSGWRKRSSTDHHEAMFNTWAWRNAEIFPISREKACVATRIGWFVGIAFLVLGILN